MALCAGVVLVNQQRRAEKEAPRAPPAWETISPAKSGVSSISIKFAAGCCVALALCIFCAIIHAIVGSVDTVILLCCARPHRARLSRDLRLTSRRWRGRARPAVPAPRCAPLLPGPSRRLRAALLPRDLLFRSNLIWCQDLLFSRSLCVAESTLNWISKYLVATEKKVGETAKRSTLSNRSRLDPLNGTKEKVVGNICSMIGKLLWQILRTTWTLRI